jgi:hypothetical protein
LLNVAQQNDSRLLLLSLIAIKYDFIEAPRLERRFDETLPQRSVSVAGPANDAKTRFSHVTCGELERAMRDAGPLRRPRDNIALGG